MRVQILGSGGYFPNERRHTSCYYLPDSSAVLDAGTGAFRLLDRLASEQLDVFLTHGHLDHICGLTYLLLPMAQGRLSSVRVYGPAPTLDAVRTHLFAQPVFPVMPEFTFLPLQDHPQVQLSDGAILTHQPLTTHPGGSTAYRIDWRAEDGRESRSLAYVTDTVVDDSYSEFVQGVNLLLHECYFPDDMAEWADKTGHSYTTAVANLARRNDVGRLLLIHVDPQSGDLDPIDVQAAQAVFAASDIAQDLTELSLEG
jgi:ribonuclease Z